MVNKQKIKLTHLSVLATLQGCILNKKIIEKRPQDQNNPGKPNAKRALKNILNQLVKSTHWHQSEKLHGVRQELIPKEEDQTELGEQNVGL